MLDKSPFHPRPCNGEILTSFLQRFSKKNMVKPHDLWRCLLKSGQHYPQASCSLYLNHCPGNVIDVGKLAWVASIDIGQIYRMTFHPVLVKFDDPSIPGALRSSRLLSNLKDESLKYCPICVKGKGYYKLTWQVKEIRVCIEHGVWLVKNCPACGSPIPLLAKDSEIGLCPACHRSLTNVKSEAPMAEVAQQGRITKDWEYLLDPATTFIPHIEQVDPKQALALALLYVAGDRASLYDRDWLLSSGINRKSIPALLQSARATRFHPAFVHLSLVLSVLRLRDMSCAEFSRLEVPCSFVESVLSEKKPLCKAYTCMAPWCQSFGKPGSLERTATSKKVVDGQHLNYYMRCQHCLSECAIDASTRGLTERGYFISLGWGKVRERLLKGERIKEIARSLGEQPDKILRCAMFLAANNLLPHEILKSYVPAVLDSIATGTIIASISNGDSVKKLWKEKKWSYREFLYYWFLPEVRLAWLSKVRRFPERKSDPANRGRLVAAALKELDRKGEQVTILKVCGVLGISQETLRLWGVLPIVKEHKLRKNETEYYQREAEYIRKADSAIVKLRLENQVVLSELVYKELGVRRTVLVRNYPSVTAYIHQRLKEIRKEAQSKKLSQYIDATKSAVAFKLSQGLPIRQEEIAGDIGLSLSGFQKYPILKKICNKTLYVYESKINAGLTEKLL